METSALNPAEKEIALRGRMIEALVTANEQLRHQISLLVSAISSKGSAYSVSEIEMLEKVCGIRISGTGGGGSGDTYSNSGSGNATNTDGYSYSEKGRGTTDDGYSYSEKEKGTTDDGYSYFEKGKGTTWFSSSISETETASPKTNPSISEKGNAQKKPLTPLPERITEQELPIYIIRGKIRELTGYKSRSSGLQNTAKLFFYLYNGGDGGYPALKKALRMSEGGVAKMLMSLRKRGLIFNKGYRQPALTETSMNIMREAWAARQEQVEG